jgi:hypothetical protein
MRWRERPYGDTLFDNPARSAVTQERRTAACICGGAA